MAPEVAKAVDALEEFDVKYETTAMGTILEATEGDELFEAAAAAHDAVDADRAVTFLKIDDKRTVEEAGERKVEKVEEELGRKARSADERNQ